MTHATKKIEHGHYEYRNHQIEEVGRYGSTGYGGAAWNITHNGATEAHDTANTLKDAKGMIDYWRDRA